MFQCNEFSYYWRLRIIASCFLVFVSVFSSFGEQLILSFIFQEFARISKKLFILKLGSNNFRSGRDFAIHLDHFPSQKTPIHRMDNNV